MTRVTYTLFDHLAAQTKTQRSVSWAGFVAMVRQPSEYATKADMPLLKLATFGDRCTGKGSLRHDANLLEVFGLEVDYDGGTISLDDAAARFEAAGVEAALHTSASHTPGAPRWRAYLPLSAPCRHEQRRQLVGVVNTILGGVVAPESFASSQSFYFGRVAGAQYEVRHVQGACVDTMALFYEPTIPAGATANDAPQLDANERALLFLDVTDETMADLRGALAALGPDWYGPGSYLNWRKVLWGLKSLALAGREAEAKALALEFSRRGGAAFDAQAFESKWREAPHSTTYRTIFEAAQVAGWVNPRSARPAPERPDGGRVDMTDTGNANALWEDTGGDLRYIVERKTWMVWDGTTWSIDESGSAAVRATMLVAERYLRLAKEKDAEAEQLAEGDRKRLLKVAESLRSWANHCRNKRGIDAMLALAARDDRFAISVSALDQDRWAFGVANGVVDLRTGKLRTAGRDDFITKRSPYAFVESAMAPRWQNFISEITAQLAPGARFAERPELAAYLHRAIGYWATGSTEEQKMFVASGAGSNGKSVALDVLAEVLGPYAVSIPPDAMMASGRDLDGERPTPYARNLAGARLAYGSEAREGQKLNAAWVKKQTGDATLTARGLHENAFTFPVTHKLVLLTNHEPHFDHMDEATRGRVHTVPFDARWNRPGVPARDPNLPDGDKGLMQKLLGEAEGILAWVVRGAVAYAIEGLEPPAEVTKRTTAYFDDQDALTQWLDTMERCAAKVGTGASALFLEFQRFCSAEGVPVSPSTQRSFAQALQKHGIQSDRVSTGTVWGLRSAPVTELI